MLKSKKKTVMAPNYEEFYYHIAQSMDDNDKKTFNKLYNKYRVYFKNALKEACEQSFSQGRDENVEFLRLGD